MAFSILGSAIQGAWHANGRSPSYDNVRGVPKTFWINKRGHEIGGRRAVVASMGVVSEFFVQTKFDTAVLLSPGSDKIPFKVVIASTTQDEFKDLKNLAKRPHRLLADIFQREPKVRRVRQGILKGWLLTPLVTTGDQFMGGLLCYCGDRLSYGADFVDARVIMKFLAQPLATVIDLGLVLGSYEATALESMKAATQAGNRAFKDDLHTLKKLI